MSNVLIVTDSISGITSDIAKEYNIRVVPGANIIFDGKSYPDGVSITAEEAYEMAQKDADKFSTSTLTPGYLLDLYRQFSKESDKIVVINFSSAVSAAYTIACRAAEMLKKESPQTDIRVIDSKTVAAGQGLLAIAAAKAAARGMDIEQIISFVGETRQQTGCIMMLDTLKYVYRTGRYSKSTARIASLLHIKPLNNVTADGNFEVFDKVRKRKDGYRRLIDFIKGEAQTDSLYFMIEHASAPELAEELSEQLSQEFNSLGVIIGPYSPIMGYASGPKCLVVGFQPEMNG